MIRSRRTTVLAIALAVTLPVLYALAAGPLVYMERIGRPVLSVETFLWIYAPLNYAEAKIKPVGLTMQFYIDFYERAAKRHLATQQKGPCDQKAGKVCFPSLHADDGLGRQAVNVGEGARLAIQCCVSGIDSASKHPLSGSMFSSRLAWWTAEHRSPGSL